MSFALLRPLAVVVLAIAAVSLSESFSIVSQLQRRWKYLQQQRYPQQNRQPIAAVAVAVATFWHPYTSFPHAKPIHSACRSSTAVFQAKSPATTGSDNLDHIDVLATDNDMTTKVDNDRYDSSTLTLLEHINLNVPNHDYCLDFYVNVLGCGLDPRKAMNVRQSKTLWVNGGASQFHLPYAGADGRAQCIPGRIGLRIRQWNDFRERVDSATSQDDSCIQHVETGTDPQGVEFVQLTDRYGNVFYCRPHKEPTELFDEEVDKDSGNVVDKRTATTSGSIGPQQEEQQQQPHDRRVPRHPRHVWRQPIIAHSETEEWGDIAAQYGRRQRSSIESTSTSQDTAKTDNKAVIVVETECSGIDFCEFYCPRGTAARIALFYDSVLDATVTVLNEHDDDDMDTIAVIAIGAVDTVTGQADQSLVFRETNDSIPTYDGHHIALYVGASAAEFDQAYRNCEMAGIVWTNPRFADQATSLPLARHFQQFRFKDIVDMETGETIFELEHEMRSINHEAWPGKKPFKR